MRLKISEMFYSIQGEGPSVGHPAVFLRLGACNLACEGFSYQDPITGKHLGCDTKLVWQKAKPYTHDEILKVWTTEGWLEKLQHGAHLVITGGEPLLQQDGVECLIKTLDVGWIKRSESAEDVIEQGGFTRYARLIRSTTEVETNGTILPNEFLSQRIDQFNVSPKLSSSLESRAKAYRPEVLQHFANLPQAIFKFVIQSEQDAAEIIRDYQTPFKLSSTRIWLMPEGGSLASMQPKMAMVAELCKTHGFNFSPRLHIHIWDEATGV